MSATKTRSLYIFFIALLGIMSLQGCNIFGKSDVEIAPYDVLGKNDTFELRHYKKLILITTPMDNMDSARGPFKKLFGYISGKNASNQKIPMTAPVFLDQKGSKTETMSFVLPHNFSLNDAPVPQDPSVKLEILKEYTVATITFNGRLTQENIEKHKKILRQWISGKKYTVTGPAKAAGYNPPYTIPQFRRNEVMIPVSP